MPITNLDTAELRTRIALVPQDGAMFAASIRDNIRFGHPDASDAAVALAAEHAHAAAFIAALPRGFDTPIGERGVLLSGGQRQRFAIARAILRDAPLLLLDEATSSLDAESETQIAAALAELMQARTTIVIAHRLATILSCDRILVMDEGRIVEEGTHAALIGSAGLYARFAKLQFEGACEGAPYPRLPKKKPGKTLTDCAAVNSLCCHRPLLLSTIVAETRRSS